MLKEIHQEDKRERMKEKEARNAQNQESEAIE